MTALAGSEVKRIVSAFAEAFGFTRNILRCGAHQPHQTDSNDRADLLQGRRKSRDSLGGLHVGKDALPAQKEQGKQSLDEERRKQKWCRVSGYVKLARRAASVEVGLGHAFGRADPQTAVWHRAGEWRYYGRFFGKRCQGFRRRYGDAAPEG